jgi:hypothetical protein
MRQHSRNKSKKNEVVSVDANEDKAPEGP